MNYFAKTAYEESANIVSNMQVNLAKCLTARNLDKKVFLNWMKGQGVKEVTDAGMDRFVKGKATTEHLSVLCLIAKYMNKNPEEVLYRILPIESFKG